MRIRNWNALNKQLGLWVVAVLAISALVVSIGIVMVANNYQMCKKHYSSEVYTCMTSPRYTVPSYVILNGAKVQGGKVCMEVN